MSCQCLCKRWVIALRCVVTVPERSPPGRSGEPTDYSATFTCDRCDKMYDSRRDLDIHKTYCRL